MLEMPGVRQKYKEVPSYDALTEGLGRFNSAPVGSFCISQMGLERGT